MTTALTEEEPQMQAAPSLGETCGSMKREGCSLCRGKACLPGPASGRSLARQAALGEVQSGEPGCTLAFPGRLKKEKPHPGPSPKCLIQSMPRVENRGAELLSGGEARRAGKRLSGWGPAFATPAHKAARGTLLPLPHKHTIATELVSPASLVMGARALLIPHTPGGKRDWYQPSFALPSFLPASHYLTPAGRSREN